VIGSLVSPALRARVRGLALPIALAFGRLGLTPNALTVIGFGISVAAAVAAGFGAWIVAALLVPGVQLNASEAQAKDLPGGGPAIAGEADDGTDVAALRDGKISVTPIYLDLTNHKLIDELATWDWGWSAPVEVSAD
jgi:hypothetical protein